MAQITSSSRFPTTWDKAIDVERIIEEVGRSIGSATRLPVMFVGENHKVTFDTDRRKRVYEGLKRTNAKMMLERGMDDGIDVVADVLLETDRATKSLDDQRNVGIIGKLKRYLDTSTSEAARKRPLVIFFGAEHEPHLKREMINQLPASLNITWTSCAPIETYIEALPDKFPAQFSLAGRKPAGYVEHDPTNIDYKIILLQKGYVHEAFNLELFSPKYLMGHDVYALYFSNERYNEKVRTEVMSEDMADVTSIIRFNGAHVVRVVRIERTRIGEAEKGALTV